MDCTNKTANQRVRSSNAGEGWCANGRLLLGNEKISIQSGTGVLNALLERGVNAVPFDPMMDGVETINKHHFNRIMICLHGRFGEDGTMQGLLRAATDPLHRQWCYGLGNCD
jgi:hypothetical protein